MYWYNGTFTGMKLAGIILIGAGFMVVLFPSNWPDGIHRLIRYGDCRHRYYEKDKRSISGFRHLYPPFFGAWLILSDGAVAISGNPKALESPPPT